MLPRAPIPLLLLLLPLFLGGESLYPLLPPNEIETGKLGTLEDMENNTCLHFKGAIKELLTFKLFYGPTPQEHVEFAAQHADRIVLNLRWKRGAPVALFIHDHLQSINVQPTLGVLAAYFNCSRRYNVVVVDWSAFAFLDYPTAVSVVPGAARLVAAGLERLEGAGAAVEHMAGHGLGAQLAGAVGRALSHPLDNIVALDPSGPLFYGPRPCQRAVSAQDALCVQVVHTDDGKMGAPRATGTVDFFPNGGARRQPGCSWWNFFDRLCSHVRALEIWKEVLQKNNTFVGRKCQSWVAFQTKKCQLPEERLQIGANCYGKAGKFYMWTHGYYPYGMGPDGSKMGPNQIN